MSGPRVGLLTVILIVFSMPVQAEEPCRVEARRVLDFWLGAWEVSHPQYGSVGTNRIMAAAGGCALREEWRGRDGHEGTSLIFLDTAKKAWRQLWIDWNGEVSESIGGMTAEGFVLSRQLPNGGTRRVVLRQLSPGRLLQLEQTRTSDTGPWETRFEGHYRRLDE